MIPKKPCKWCKDIEPNHWPYQCRDNPDRKKMNWWYSPGNIKQFGHKNMEWTAIRRKWFIENEADHYICYLCRKWLTPSETTLDHVIPRSNAKNYPNRHDFSNLRPCCWGCNGEKGSKVY